MRQVVNICFSNIINLVSRDSPVLSCPVLSCPVLSRPTLMAHPASYTMSIDYISQV